MSYFPSLANFLNLSTCLGAFSEKDVELKKDGAGAQAGKIAFSITSKITKLSAGRRSFSTLNRKRKELWRKYTPPGMKSPTKGVFWKHTVSKIHNFTDWRVFDTLHKEHTKQMNLKKSSKRKFDREQLGFQRRIDEQGRLDFSRKALLEKPEGWKPPPRRDRGNNNRGGGRKPFKGRR